MLQTSCEMLQTGISTKNRYVALLSLSRTSAHCRSSSREQYKVHYVKVKCSVGPDASDLCSSVIDRRFRNARCINNDPTKQI
eukprot:6479966-Amphidinium_carterae.1